VFAFLIKKAFFDLWDNLLRIVILNLGYIVAGALIIYPPYLFKSVPVLFFLSFFLGLLILCAYTGAVSGMVRQIADYQQPEARQFVSLLKASLPTSVLFALLNAALFLLLNIAFPVYQAMRSLVGSVASSFLFWFLVLWILAGQFFYPIQSQLDRRFGKMLKKMFLLLLDNPLFSIGLFLGVLFILAVSLFTALLLPGISAAMLWLNVGLKLRLYKYDYLEKNPEGRKTIPWDALLVTDRERVGKRTLKGMIFPWKE